jgi:hypothetical protein
MPHLISGSQRLKLQVSPVNSITRSSGSEITGSGFYLPNHTGFDLKIRPNIKVHKIEAHMTLARLLSLFLE